MSDTIGRITVPTVINSGQTFPLTTQYPFGFSVERPVIVYRFGNRALSRLRETDLLDGCRTEERGGPAESNTKNHRPATASSSSQA